MVAAPASKVPTMLGAIAGDIIGSIYEVDPIKRADFSPLFDDERCRFTDDTVLTVATAHAILSTGAADDDDGQGERRFHVDYASSYRKFGRIYPRAGYGSLFIAWCGDDIISPSRTPSPPYGSWGNGSAMRVSPVEWAFDKKEEVLYQAERSAAVTHNHPEGIKGAQATALAVYMARKGRGKDDIKSEIESSFGYDLDRRVEDIRPAYTFDLSCQGSVPEAIICFLESKSVEDAIRLAVSLGGDADTQACIAGSIAEAYYGPLDAAMVMEVRNRLPAHLLGVIDDFTEKFLAN